MKTVVLLSHFREVTGWVINFMRERKIENVAYIMDAKKPRLKSDPSYVFEDKIEFEKAGFKIEFIDLEMLNPKKIESKFDNFDAVYIKGGNTFCLLNAMEKSGFNKVVHKLIDRGVIYIGESAGSYVACPTIEMANWKHQDKNFINLKDLTALELVPFLITAHYTPEIARDIDSEIKNSKFKVKTLTDHEVIVVEDDKDRLIKV